MTDQIHHTSCTMDCPDTCELEVLVRDGKIRKISGARDGHPDTAGFICSKVARFHRRVYHPDRLLYPMRRRGEKGAGQFERISWESAIEEIVRRFQEIKTRWGGEAILPYHYGGSNGLLGDEFLDSYFFAKLGASRCAKTLCAAPSGAVAGGMYGKMPGVAFEDFTRAKFILLWGVNPKVANIHLVPYLRQAKKNGAFIAVVDPKCNFSENEIDLHLPVYPGADLPLALSMINYWRENDLLDLYFLDAHGTGLEPLLEAAAEWPIERAARTADVSPFRLIKLAKAYADAQPALLRCGWGVERNQNGGQAIAAILAMPALLGKFGVPGGGYTLSNSAAARMDKEKIFGKITWNTRLLNQTRLGRLLNEPLEPPVKGLFVYNCNPAATVPDQNAVLRGLAREDLFTVVFEQVMTDTARYADILLPAVTFLEQQEIRRAYGSYAIGGVQPVIPPSGEAKPNEAVFAMLGQAFGWDDKPFQWDSDAYMNKVVQALNLNGQPGNHQLLLSGKTQPYRFENQLPVQFKTVFPGTADSRIHLTPAALGKQPYQYHPVQEAQFPLALISPANAKMISSTLGEFNYPELWVDIYPEDATARNIDAGARVRVFNQLGEVICRANLNDALRPGVVSMPKGAWGKSSLNHRTSTALCPDTVNRVGGGACYNDARVEIERFEEI